MNDVAAKIAAETAGRDPALLVMRERLMRQSPFAFFRGTAHLFAEDWAEHAPDDLRAAPRSWLCGDLHLENLGTYRASDSLVVFDLNDFDEAYLGPCLYDLARCIASSIVWFTEFAHPGEAADCGEAMIDGYAAELARGKALWLDRVAASGPIATLMDNVTHRSRAMLLDSRTVPDAGSRSLRLDRHALPVDDAQRRRALDIVAVFAQKQRDPGHWEPVDVARRVAGLGSLGLERYVVLTRGDGTRDGMRLLDVKHQPGSALAGCIEGQQPAWPDDATRVVEVQRRMQAREPRRLDAVTYAGDAFTVRTLQPTSDKLDLAHPEAIGDAETLHLTAGSLLAWAQLRSGGREGSAIADEAIAFGRAAGWRASVLAYATGAAERLVTAYRAYARPDA